MYKHFVYFYYTNKLLLLSYGVICREERKARILNSTTGLADFVRGNLRYPQCPTVGGGKGAGNSFPLDG